MGFDLYYGMINETKLPSRVKSITLCQVTILPTILPCRIIYYAKIPKLS